MSAYDLEEQERIAALKDWWEKWGNLIYAGLIAFFLGIAGTQAWRWYQQKQAIEGETLFVSVQNLSKEVAVSKEWKKLSDAATALAEKYPATFYATEVQLMAAKAAFESKQYAEASKHLQWVIDKGRKSHVNVARIRLASIQLDEKKYDDALKTLDAIKEEGFASIAADLRGDVYAAQGKRDEARAAYELATTKADERSPLKGISQAKLDAFGGATAKPAAKAADDKAADGKSGDKSAGAQK